MNQSDQATLTIEQIKQALNQPLPGKPAQQLMAPMPVTNKFDRWPIPEDCREAGVLLLLFEKEAELHVTLTRRHTYPGVHSGQIAFPGGQREQDEALQETALRETYEEVGVLPESLEVIGQLSRLYTPPSNFCIFPFVAFYAGLPAFQPDSREVAELIEAPLNLFLNPATQKKELWHFENFGERNVPYFDIFGHKVWGATAMIFSEFITLLDSNSIR